MTFVAFTALIQTSALAQTSPPPQRIVSLNLCTDELVLRLADQGRVASVTWLARSPSGSNVSHLAMQVPVNDGHAEEIVALRPDLVVAGQYAARNAVDFIKRTHIPLALFAVPNSIDAARTQITQMARLLQAQTKGENLVREIDARIAAIDAAPLLTRPSAIVLNPDGLTVRRDSLADEIMSRAGLDNVARRLGLDNYGQFPLELIVMNSIDVIIIGAHRDGPPALATEILNHPVLAHTRARIVVMPSRLWSCAGPGIADALEQLQAVATDISRRRPAP